MLFKGPKSSSIPQVPVKPDGLPEPHVSSSSVSTKSDRFTLPKKLICMNTSGSYKVETHQVTPMVLRAEQVCTYDLDNVDQHWLNALNGERARTGQSNLTETEMERSVEELERQCWEKINSTLRNSDDMETAQDDSIICDVCRSVSKDAVLCANDKIFFFKCWLFPSRLILSDVSHVHTEIAIIRFLPLYIKQMSHG